MCSCLDVGRCWMLERLKYWQVPYCQTSAIRLWDLGSPCSSLETQGNLHHVSSLPPSSVNSQVTDREGWKSRRMNQESQDGWVKKDESSLGGPPMVHPIRAFGIYLCTQISSTELLLQIDVPVSPNVWKGQHSRLIPATLLLLAFALLITKGCTIHSSRISAYVREGDENSPRLARIRRFIR